LKNKSQDLGNYNITNRERLFKGFILGFLGILLFGLILYLGLVSIGAVLIVADPITQVDAVVALSGGDGDRLALAIDMHKRGLAPSLVITDTTRGANRLLKNEAEAGGFPEDEIYVTDMQVGSTVDEARAVRSFAQDQGWDSLMIVTDPFHSFRTRFIFRRELRNSDIDIYIRPVVGHWFRSSTWFFRLEGWRFAFLEIVKFFSYLLFRR